MFSHKRLEWIQRFSANSWGELPGQRPVRYPYIPEYPDLPSFQTGTANPQAEGRVTFVPGPSGLFNDIPGMYDDPVNDEFSGPFTQHP